MATQCAGSGFLRWGWERSWSGSGSAFPSLGERTGRLREAAAECDRSWRERGTDLPGATASGSGPRARPPWAPPPTWEQRPELRPELWSVQSHKFGAFLTFQPT